MTAAPHDVDDIPPESNWPYDPPQVPKELLDLAARTFCGGDPSEPQMASLERTVTAVVEALRTKLSDYLLGDLAMTNSEMSAFVPLDETDPRHEECGRLYMDYAARIVREST